MRQGKKSFFAMDNTSLHNIVERIPELKLQYLGSFPADIVPNSINFSSAIINTRENSEVCEYWIMIGRVNRHYYLANFLA